MPAVTPRRPSPPRVMDLLPQKAKPAAHAKAQPFTQDHSFTADFKDTLAAAREAEPKRNEDSELTKTAAAKAPATGRKKDSNTKTDRASEKKADRDAPDEVAADDLQAEESPDAAQAEASDADDAKPVAADEKPSEGAAPATSDVLIATNCPPPIKAQFPVPADAQATEAAAPNSHAAASAESPKAAQPADAGVPKKPAGPKEATSRENPPASVTAKPKAEEATSEATPAPEESPAPARQTPVAKDPRVATAPRAAVDKQESTNPALTEIATAIAAPIITAPIAEAPKTLANTSSDGPREAPPAAPTIPTLTASTLDVPRPAASAEVAAAAQESPAPDAQQTYDQVVLGLRGKLDARSGKAEIRLDPPNLGPLHVSVSLENGALTAQFQSSSELVRNLLKDNLEKLKTVLQGQGVAVDRLAVEAPESASQPQGGQSQQPNFGSAAHDGRSAGQYSQDRAPRRRDADAIFSRLLGNTEAAPMDLVA